ncbi:MAG: MBL fold metallo-hydrolase [Candidatus Berkelbacteria bacterium]|nr:MBL fold metallo-hydrolase [Candidatus Berkelbacteria bacterium]
MKITFLGLSAFVIEDIERHKILLDPFDDRPEFQLGVDLPGNLEADFACFSHKDPDHYNPLVVSKYPAPGGNILKRTVVGNEFNGDEFMINIFEIDNMTIAHFADQSVAFSEEQLASIGKVDIAIYSPPKADGKLAPKALKVVIDNLNKLNPKMIIWSHFIVPDGWQTNKTTDELREFFRDYLGKNANSNKNYNSRDSFIELCYILENGIDLNQYFNGSIVAGNSIDINELPQTMTSVLFSKMS